MASQLCGKQIDIYTLWSITHLNVCMREDENKPDNSSEEIIEE